MNVEDTAGVLFANSSNIGEAIRELDSISSSYTDSAFCSIFLIGLASIVYNQTVEPLNQTIFHPISDDDMFPSEFTGVLSEGISGIGAEDPSAVNSMKDVVIPGFTYKPKNITFTYDNICNYFQLWSWQAQIQISCFAIFCGFTVVENIVVFLLRFLDPFFRTPIFITLQSFSMVSIMHAVELMFESISFCMKISDLLCLIKSVCSSYVKKVYLLHLSVLASQRIYITLFPLKSKVYQTKKNVLNLLVSVYLICLIYEIAMTLFGFNNCNMSSAVSVRDTSFVVVNGITCFLLLFAMIASIIKSLDSKRLQTVNQKSQSRIASYVMIVYIVMYCPTVFLGPIFSLTCDPDKRSITSQGIDFFSRCLDMLILFVNPITLCLRSKRAREALLSKFKSTD